MDDLGHTFEPDPIAALTSMKRETCTVCHFSRIVRPDGSAYGSAVEMDCEEGQLERLAENARMDWAAEMERDGD